ncbi:MAG: MBL fold metallo-hydrolase [Syntrophales bacterium]
MKIRFWGVRGSIPSPGAKTVRYGGNTTCIEVKTDSGQTIILDAGTGIYPLSQQLLSVMPLTCHIFITHTHWDHIQGLPFFLPLFISGNDIRIYGAFDPLLQKDIGDVLRDQMAYSYFPVRETELAADIQYTSLRERQTTEIGSTLVTGIITNHTALNFGYLIESNGKKVFFTGDNEELFNIYSPEDDSYEEYNQIIQHKNDFLHDFIRGANVIIADSAYTSEEYLAKKGWGHGTYEYCIEMAKKAEVPSLYFTHHEPLRSDDELDRIKKQLEARFSSSPGTPLLYMAYEGLEINL